MLGEYLNFIVSRSGANLPGAPPRPLSPAAISQRRLASPDPCSQSAILTIRACLLAQGCQSTPMESIHDNRSCCWWLQGRQRPDRVRVVLRRAAPCSAVPTRWRVARDDAFASDDDFWVFEHLRVVNFHPVHTPMALLVDRVRRYIPSVCLLVS